MKKETDSKPFFEILRKAFKLFNIQQDAETRDMWFVVLSKYDIDQVRSAFNEVVRESIYAPKPAQVIGKIEGNTKNQALEQANLVLETIVKPGSMASVCFADQVTMTVILRTGGWRKLCNTYKTEDEPWFIKRFIENYELYKRQAYPEAISYLRGDEEITSRRFGRTYDPPRLIGKGAKMPKQIACHNETSIEINKMAEGIGRIGK